jgi:recA bacterial DNA recombination protein
VAVPARDLTQLLSDLRRTRALVTPEELAHRLPPVLPTGLPELDRLLGGGLPEGRIVEIGESKGALGTALALRILARVTESGRLAAVIDRRDCFDPRSAAEAGVDLERTLWCRPGSHKDAVRAADVLLASGAFALVVLDLGVAPQRRRGPRAESAVRSSARPGGGVIQLVPDSSGRVLREPEVIRTAPGEGAPPDELHVERYAVRKKRRDPDADTISQAAWLRLARDAEAARASLLVLGGEGAGTFATASLRPLRTQARFAGEGPGRTFEGLELTVALERNKLGRSPGETVVLPFGAPELFPTGQRDPLPGAARIADDPAASRRKAWHVGTGD